jgi:preprotein translocase subunit SecD
MARMARADHPEADMWRPILSGVTLAALLAPGVTAETLKLEIESVEIGADSFTQLPTVKIVLKPDSKAAIAEFTRARIGEPVTLRLDSVPLTAPIVQEPIVEGILVISGSLTQSDAAKLAREINSGAGTVFIDGSDK